MPVPRQRTARFFSAETARLCGSTPTGKPLRKTRGIQMLKYFSTEPKKKQELFTGIRKNLS